MKKYLSLICVMLCLFGLTACAGEEVLTQRDKEKISTVESAVAPQAVELLRANMTDEAILALSEFTAEEITYQVQSLFQSNVEGYAFMNGLESFRSGSKEIGGIVGFGKVSAVIDDKQILATVEVIGGEKNAKAELIFSNDMFMQLESASLNPTYTGGEMMGKAALNTVIGLGTVFSVLIIMIMIISLFKYIPRIQESFSGKKKNEEIRTEGVNNAVSQIVEQEESVNAGDDMELIAVIGAAIAASQGAVSADGFVVRSIRKVKRSR